MATSASGGAQRGGWSYTLKTQNLMKDPPASQPSLSEGLRMGAFMAHRRVNMVADVDPNVDNRNFRRSNPVGERQELGPLSQRSGRETPAVQSPEAVRLRQQAQVDAAYRDPANMTTLEKTRANNMAGVSRAEQLDVYRRRRGPASR